MALDEPLVALTIAGSDSGGGAGIQADLATFAVHHIFGTSALTAITAQNTLGVQRVSVLDPEMVMAQITSVRDDLEVAAAKTGMLATAAIIESLRQHLVDRPLPHLVIDPVMVATTGAWLLEGEARESYLSLLPHADLITPNLPEAAYLTDQSVNDQVSMVTAAYALYELGARHVLIKGGHLVGEQAEDLFFDGDDLQWLSADRVATRNVHGTGCTLSAAITANLALGFSMLEAIDRAKRYLTACLNASVDWRLGQGSGAFARLSVEASFDQE